MYTNKTLIKLYKKTTRIKHSLARTNMICNSIKYTEQNTEELNNVKAFIAFKLDVLADIRALIEQFFKSKQEFPTSEFEEQLNELTEYFNKIAKDAYLSHLQQMYSNQSQDLSI